MNTKLLNRFVKQIPLLIFILFLFGCGGGGSSSGTNNIPVTDDDSSSTDIDNTQNDNSSGSGGCVSYPRLKVGQVIKRILRDSNGNEMLTSEERILVSTDTTFIVNEKDILVSGFESDSNEITKFTISNNYMDITEDSGSIYTPFKRVPIDKVCEGQTWTSTYVENDGFSAAQLTHSIIFTVEAVNISRVTPAGQFNTFRLKQEEGEQTVLSWIDIDSGYDVFSKYDNISTVLGIQNGTTEIIEKNF